MVISSNNSAVEFVRNDIMNRLAALGLSGIFVNMDPSIKWGRGVVETMPDDDLSYLHVVTSISIGIDRKDMDSLDMMAVFKLLKVAGHEMQHVIQEHIMTYDNSLETYYMSLADVCRLAVFDYYVDKINYASNICECEADISGLIYAYSVFAEHWNSDIASHYLRLCIASDHHAEHVSVYLDSLNPVSTLVDLLCSYVRHKGTIFHRTRNCACLSSLDILSNIKDECDGIKQDEMLARYLLSTDPHLKDIVLSNTPSLYRLFA